jgi:CRP-like cAMP-binding protein
MEKEDTNAELLTRLPALDGAGAEVMAWLAEHVQQTTFEAGARLVAEGDDDRDCYLLVDGDVEVTRHDGLRETDHAGDVTGELALLYRKRRSATATAITRVTALRLAAADFDALTARSPRLAQDTAEAIVDYVRFRFGFQPPPGPWQPPG